MSGKYCLFCGATAVALARALALCSKCKRAAYCSPECQKLDWSVHKLECYKEEPPLPMKTVDMTQDGCRMLNANHAALKMDDQKLHILAALDESAELLLTGMRVDKHVACILTQHYLTGGDDENVWQDAAAMVRAQGGQLVFGWCLYANEHVVCARSSVAWLEGATFWTTLNEATNGALFVPDQRVMEAYRVHGHGPPRQVLWL